jgi:magnesium-transporting ATPase (P-type)
LSFVVLINSFKDFLEDSKKKAFDNKENNREVYIFNIEEKKFEKKLSKDIKVGDVIKVFNEEFLPVDLILVSSQSNQEEDMTKINEDEIGGCYYESKNLDGETNLKFKQAHKEIAKKYRKDEDLVNLKGMITCSPPSEYINEFGGRYVENTKDNENFIPLDKHCFLLRGCKLKQIFCIIGIAVYVGHNTKMLMNYPSHKNKTASTQSKLNIHVLILLILDIIICIITEIMHIVSPNVRNSLL